MWILKNSKELLENLKAQSLYPFNSIKKGKRKVQGMPQSQTTALSRHQEEEETDKTKQAQIEQKDVQKATRLALSPHKRGNRNARRTEKHKNKITQGKT